MDPMRQRRALSLLLLSGTAALLISAACSSEVPAPGPSDAGGSSAQPDSSGGTPYAPPGDPDSGSGKGSYDALFDRCGKNCLPM
jgi:hypothetical protein